VSAGAAAGVVSGLAGAAAMAAVAKAEQLVTNRPDSYVPAHTLGRLLRLPDPDAHRWGRNMAMHYASGRGGAVRGVMWAANLRGPLASLMHMNLRLSPDQTLENLTGAGGGPRACPLTMACRRGPLESQSDADQGPRRRTVHEGRKTRLHRLTRPATSRPVRRPTLVGDGAG
jgi:hypothetical protein